MGYTTDFFGDFRLDKPLTAAHKAYLTAFAETRRMKRDSNFTATYDDPLREAVGLPIGDFAEYYVGTNEDSCGILNYNEPPPSQPGLWCQWTPNLLGTAIQWDGGEKFYDYTQWLQYLITEFIEPWEYKLNGTVEWKGEEDDDSGTITVKDNIITKIRNCPDCRKPEHKGIPCKEVAGIPEVPATKERAIDPEMIRMAASILAHESLDEELAEKAAELAKRVIRHFESE